MDAQGGCGGVRGGDESAQGDGVGAQGEEAKLRCGYAHTPPKLSVSSEASAFVRLSVSAQVGVLSFSMEKVSLQARGVSGACAKPPVITGESVSFLQK